MKRQRGMGSVFKQPGSDCWWISYYVKRDGVSKRIRESTGLLKQSDAVAVLKKRTGQIADGTWVSPSVGKNLRLSDLVRLVETDYAINKFRSAASRGSNSKRLLDYFGDALISQLNETHIERFKQVLTTEKHYEPASINRSLAILRRGFKLAQKQKLLTTAPDIETLHESNVRQGFLEMPDFQRLRDALPEGLRDPVSFLYLSGWRKSEMMSLQWSTVDLADKMIRLAPENSKNKHARMLPLSGELLAIIKRAHSQRQLGCPFVFHRNGKPIRNFTDAWKNACRETRLNVLIHDMRRSAVRNFIRAGFGQKIAMARSGHRSISVFQRYDIIDERDQREAADRLDDYLAQRSS